MLSYHDALSCIAALPRIAGSERLPISACAGRVLAGDLTARVPSPVFTNSAMDGFAIRHADALSGRPLRIKGTLVAGQATLADAVSLQAGDCIRVMTGAPLPPWADTVVPVEQALVDHDDSMLVRDLPSYGAHIRQQGEDLARGDLVLRSGTLLDAERLMLAAAFGYATLDVALRPELLLATTGDELAELGGELQPGMIYNSNRVYLEAAARASGLPCHSMTLLDDPAVAAQRLAKLLDHDRPKLFISSGAVSAGSQDFVPQLAATLGFTVHFHKVAVRPGKPVFLASRGRTVWLGLPGNPLATCVGWHYFVRPLLTAMCGLPSPVKRWVHLQHSVAKPAALRCFFRAEVLGEVATVAVAQGSAHLAASRTSNAYVELPEGYDPIPAETRVEAIIV